MVLTVNTTMFRFEYILMAKMEQTCFVGLLVGVVAVVCNVTVVGNIITLAFFLFFVLFFFSSSSFSVALCTLVSFSFGCNRSTLNANKEMKRCGI